MTTEHERLVMCAARVTEPLKVRLKLKFLTKKIDELVNWNFGYCPSGDKHFDRLLEEKNRYLDIAKAKYPELYDLYT